jgi:ankyrin repeat protein
MARKKAQRKQETTTLVPHRTPSLSALLERAKSGDSARSVKAYLDAGGLATAVVEFQGAAALLSVPLLYNVVATDAHPHRELAESARLLLAAGADIKQNDFTGPDGTSLTPLMCAVERTCCTAVQTVLLQANADPCVRSPGTGITALHSAAVAGAVGSCKLLLQRADTLLEERDMYGRTALRCAANAGKLSIVQVLVQHGADVNTVDHKGRTPLCGACLYQHASVAAFLLEAGADVHAVDQYGASVLMAAAQSESSVTLLQLLLDHGVEISATDNNGQHALFSAARYWSVVLIEKLVSSGVSVHTVDNIGNTVLMRAVGKGRKAAAE